LECSFGESAEKAKITIMTIAVSKAKVSRRDEAASPGPRSDMREPTSLILEARDLELRFGAINALRSVDLKVYGGSIHSVIGPNGAGKSSLLNCLSGFYWPQSGAVLFNGQNISRRSPHARGKAGIGRTFQGIQTYQSMTVRENILAGLHAHMRTGLLDALVYWPRARAEEQLFKAEAEEIIEFLELEDLRHDQVGNLSYGMRKRVDLGRALALRPKVLIMDEPMAGMSVDEKGDLARFILDIRDARRIPIVLVEHDMEVVMDISDTVTVMDWGIVIASGAPQHIRNDPKVIAAYLGQAKQ
jgi:branched-chain amino acid transport system ATP-binding protein